MDCDLNSCSIGSDFPGSDGRTHRVEFDDFSITGDEINGYNVNAIFIHATHGEVMISTTVAVYFGLCGPFPHDGSIMYSSTDGSSGSITFTSDCFYTGEWDDGAGNTGTYEGNLPVT